MSVDVGFTSPFFHHIKPRPIARCLYSDNYNQWRWLLVFDPLSWFPLVRPIATTTKRKTGLSSAPLFQPRLSISQSPGCQRNATAILSLWPQMVSTYLYSATRPLRLHRSDSLFRWNQRFSARYPFGDSPQRHATINPPPHWPKVRTA